MDELEGIAPPSKVFARADALMNRRRPVSPSEAEDIPVLTDVVGDDELPVLDAELPATTVATPPAAAPTPLTPAGPAPAALAEQLSTLVQRRLEAELPNLVEAALAAAMPAITADLRRGVEDTARDVLAEFAARQRHD
ncbi:MAG: hypothetical protein KA603_02775 [Azonexus sp.]|jgi:hypothetical protein|nr:hypothetical protein [Betaproteobacteria bacterium]MBK8917279.1 hypothetical protein [Betaproteobacteria bacterium]MBP6035042.1 hypothetical protein [Azonexus sp.]MBP6905980.1 hypothetical protein [Azonexus sp.]